VCPPKKEAGKSPTYCVPGRVNSPILGRLGKKKKGEEEGLGEGRLVRGEEGEDPLGRKKPYELDRITKKRRKDKSTSKMDSREGKEGQPLLGRSRHASNKGGKVREKPCNHRKGFAFN